jgi:hypothetical protein
MVTWIISGCIAIVILGILLVFLSIKEVVPHVMSMLEYLENNQMGLD